MLFKSIVQDIDLMLVQCGPPDHHQMEGGKIMVLLPSECKPTPHTLIKVKICPQIFK